MTCQPWLIEHHLPRFVIRVFHLLDALPAQGYRSSSTRVCDQSFPSPRCLASPGLSIIIYLGLWSEFSISWMPWQPAGLIEQHLPGFVIRVFHLLDALPARGYRASSTRVCDQSFPSPGCLASPGLSNIIYLGLFSQGHLLGKRSSSSMPPRH
jgi:hypothetical protein